MFDILRRVVVAQRRVVVIVLHGLVWYGTGESREIARKIEIGLVNLVKKDEKQPNLRSVSCDVKSAQKKRTREILRHKLLRH